MIVLCLSRNACTYVIAMYVDPRWLIVVVSASIVYGLLSSIIAARRLFFLAGALPHSALLAAVLAIIASKTIGGGAELWALAISIVLVSSIALLISKGVEPDSATAIFVSFSVSSTAIGIYYVLTMFPVETSLWAYILGDPLLVTWRDVNYMVIVSLAILALIVPFLREHILIGVDRDFVKLSGVKVVVYDTIFMVSLALATVGLLRAVGFVVEHVMLLLPGTIAAMVARNSRSAVLLGLIVSMISGVAGLVVSILTGFAPSGVIGLILLSVYVVSLATRRMRGYG